MSRLEIGDIVIVTETDYNNINDYEYTVTKCEEGYSLQMDNGDGVHLHQEVSEIDDLILQLNEMKKSEFDGWFLDWKIKKEQFKFEYINVNNFQIAFMDASIRASKLPMSTDASQLDSEITQTVKNLSKAPIGSGHSCFNKGIMVNMDLTATNKLWVQWLRYHHQEIISSQSSMHRLSRFDLNNSDLFIRYTDDVIIERLQVLQKLYNDDKTKENYLILMYSCPSGLRLTANVTLNLEQIRTMINQRENHKLPEWRELCDYFRSIDEFKKIIEL